MILVLLGMETPVISGNVYNPSAVGYGHDEIASLVRKTQLPDVIKGLLFDDLVSAATGLAGMSTEVILSSLIRRITAFENLVKLVDESAAPQAREEGWEDFDLIYYTHNLLRKILFKYRSVPMLEQRTRGLTATKNHPEDIKVAERADLPFDAPEPRLLPPHPLVLPVATQEEKIEADLDFANMERLARNPPRSKAQGNLKRALAEADILHKYTDLIEHPENLTTERVKEMVSAIMQGDPMRYDRVIQDRFVMLKDLQGVSSIVGLKESMITQSFVRNLIRDMQGVAPAMIRQLQNRPSADNNYTLFILAMAANFVAALGQLKTASIAQNDSLMDQMVVALPTLFKRNNLKTRTATTVKFGGGTDKKLIFSLSKTFSQPRGGYKTLIADPNTDLIITITAYMKSFPAAMAPALHLFSQSLLNTQYSHVMWNAGLSGGAMRLHLCQKEWARRKGEYPEDFYNIETFMSEQELVSRHDPYWDAIHGVFGTLPTELLNFLINACFPERPSGIMPDFNRDATAPHPFANLRMGDLVRDGAGDVSDTVHSQFMRLTEGIIKRVVQHMRDKHDDSTIVADLRSTDPEAFYNKVILKMEPFELRQQWDPGFEISNQVEMKDYIRSWVEKNKLPPKGRCIWVGNSCTAYANMIFGALFESMSSHVSKPSMTLHYLYGYPGIKDLLGLSIADGNYDMIMGWLLMRPDPRSFPADSKHEEAPSASSSSSSTSSSTPPEMKYGVPHTDLENAYNWEEDIPLEEVCRTANFSDNIFITSYCRGMLKPESLFVLPDVEGYEQIRAEFKRTGTVHARGIVYGSLDVIKAESQIPFNMYAKSVMRFLEHFNVHPTLRKFFQLVLRHTVGWSDSLLANLKVTLDIMFSGTRWTTFLNKAFTWHIIYNTKRKYQIPNIQNVMRYCKEMKIGIKLTNLLYISNRQDLHKLSRFDYNWLNSTTAVHFTDSLTNGFETDFLGFDTVFESTTGVTVSTAPASIRYENGLREQNFPATTLRPMLGIFVGKLNKRRLYSMLTWNKPSAYPAAETGDDRESREKQGKVRVAKPKTATDIMQSKFQAYISAYFLGARFYPEMTAVLSLAIANISEKVVSRIDNITIEGVSGDSPTVLTREQFLAIKDAVVSGQVESNANAMWYYPHAYEGTQRTLPFPFVYVGDLQPPRLGMKFTRQITDWLVETGRGLSDFVYPWRTAEDTPPTFHMNRVNLVLPAIAERYGYKNDGVLLSNVLYTLGNLGRVYLRPVFYKGRPIYPENKYPGDYDPQNIDPYDTPSLKDYLTQDPDPKDNDEEGQEQGSNYEHDMLPSLKRQLLYAVDEKVTADPPTKVNKRVRRVKGVTLPGDLEEGQASDWLGVPYRSRPTTKVIEGPLLPESLPEVVATDGPILLPQKRKPSQGDNARKKRARSSGT